MHILAFGLILFGFLMFGTGHAGMESAEEMRSKLANVRHDHGLSSDFKSWREWRLGVISQNYARSRVVLVVGTLLMLTGIFLGAVSM